MIRWALMISTVAFAAGCGTDTGNPLDRREAMGEDPQAIVQGFVSGPLCARLKACFTEAPANCEAGVDEAPEITAALALDTVAYPTLRSAKAGLSEGKLALAKEEAIVCNDAIAAVSCSDPLILQAYDPANPANYDQVHRLLSVNPGCRRMIR